MRSLSVTDDILPIHEFKTRASKVISTIKRTGRPVVVTQNGRASAVVISTTDFDRLTALVRLSESLENAQRDVAAGRLTDHDAVFSEFEGHVRQRSK